MAPKVVLTTCIATLVIAVSRASHSAHGVDKRPHIVFIVSDDLGYNDVSFHGSTQIPTPNLDALAHSGVIMSHYFVQPVCSPTRATFASGRHVIHTGVYDPMNGGSGDLSLNFSLWSNGFKSLGYRTAAVGKWHIGMSSWRYTPLERGFDAYYGYLGGAEDYWTHYSGPAVDFFDGRNPVTNASCTTHPGNSTNACPLEYYSANLFTKRAIQEIELAGQPGAAPLFLYLAYQSVHSPDEAPQYLIDSFADTIPNVHRRTFAAMVTALDQGVGNVTSALKDSGIYANTLLVFSTDNGGPADNFDSNMACNWPLRGMKRTLFEGGVRGVGFVHGVGLQRTQWVADGYVHAADWFHTLLRVGALGVASNVDANTSAATVRKLLPANEPPFELGDGVDMWNYLSGAVAASPRTEVLHESHAMGSDDGNGNALRVGDLKVVIRTGAAWSTGCDIGTNDGWYGGAGSSDTASAAYCVNAHDLPKYAVQCPPPPKNVTQGFACEQDTVSPCLFNVTADPCEHYDLSATHADALHTILLRLRQYQVGSVYGPTARHNPDGPECPYVATLNGVKVFMPCDNNGSHPVPPPTPSPPPPADAFELRHADSAPSSDVGSSDAHPDAPATCLDTDLSVKPCAPAIDRVWYFGRNGHASGQVLKNADSCLKILELVAESSPPDVLSGNCNTWKNLHVGTCRGDNNSFAIEGTGGKLSSNACDGKCAVVLPGTTEIHLGDCNDASASGWSEVHA